MSAGFEWAITDVFDAAGTPVLTGAALAAVPVERWDGLRLDPIAAWRLLRLDWPVHRTLEAYEAERCAPHCRC
jgi:hypothetical protein